MKIMYLNPVQTSKYDLFFGELLNKHKLPETELHITSFKDDKIDHIEFFFSECCVSKDIISSVYKASQEGFDAFVIGCYYDTALFESREISGDMFVVGPCQCSVHLAMHLANNFSIILANRKSSAKIERNLKIYGYHEKLVSFEYTDQHIPDFQINRTETFSRLISAGQRAKNNYAEAIILGCTLEANFNEELENELGLPVIDASIAALKSAEMLASLKISSKIRPSRIWGSSMPSADFFLANSGINNVFEFGNRIIF